MPERLRGVGQPPRQLVRVAQRDECVRIVAPERLEQRDRLARLTGLREVLPELDPHFALRDAVLERALERLDRVGRAAVTPVDERQLAVRVLRVAALRDDALIEGDRIARTPLLIRLRRAMHRLLELDEPLRIVVVRIAFAHGGRAAAHVSERSQTLERLGRLFARPAGRRQVEALEDVDQHLRPARAHGRDVGRLFRIAREVVELGDRQINVFLAADEHTAQRRPSARDVRRHRLEVGRAIVAAARRDDRPERRAGVVGAGRQQAFGVEDRRQNVDVTNRRLDRHALKLRRRGQGRAGAHFRRR